MMKKAFLVFLFLVGFVFVTSNAYAAWTQAKGHSYNQLSFSHYKTIEKFNSLGYDRGGLGASVTDLNTSVHRSPSEEFTSTKISYYGEFGLTNKITGIVSAAWDWQKTNDAQKYSDNDGPSGIGDIIIGLRHKLTDNLAAGVLSSVEFGLKIPEAYKYGDPFRAQSLGDGQYDFVSKLLFGRGFGWGYTVLSLGYKYRFENNQLGNGIMFKPSDVMEFGLNGGYNVLPWLSLRGSLTYNKPVGNAEVSPELLAHANAPRWQQDTVIIKDGLGLEAESLNAGIALAFSVRSNTQLVLSYNRDVYGRDAAIGDTFALALAVSL